MNFPLKKFDWIVISTNLIVSDGKNRYNKKLKQTSRSPLRVFSGRMICGKLL